MKKSFRFISVILLLAAVGSGCSSAVYFTSNPSGADLRINGVHQGTTPCSVKLNWTTFKQFDVRLEKEGYHPYVAKLEGEPKWAYIVIDALFLWPLLLVNAYGPKASYTFNLRQAQGGTEIASPTEASSEVEKEPKQIPVEPGGIVIYEELELRPRIACLEFKKGNAGAGDYTTTVQEMFSTGFAESRRFTIVEREQIQAILKEKQFAKTDEVDAETARELGKVLGVEYLVIGSISKLDNTFEIDARLVDVRSGETKIASHESSYSASGLRAAVNSIVNDLNRKFSAEK